MSKKKQHYVPRVYMKAWETKVETSRQPNNKFEGVYVFNDSDIGEDLPESIENDGVAIMLFVTERVL